MTNLNFSLVRDLIQSAFENQVLVVGVLVLVGMVIVYKMITSGDWVRVLAGIGILIFVVHLLSGCSAGSDLGGFTERAQIRADAGVQAAEIDKDKAIGVAKQQKEGLVASTQVNAEAQVNTNKAWANALPTALTILCFTFVLVVMINWKGKLDIVQATMQGKILLMDRKLLLHNGPPNLDGRPPTPQLTKAQLQALYYYAQKRNLQVRVISGEHYLTDGRVTYKALLKDPEDKY